MKRIILSILIVLLIIPNLVSARTIDTTISLVNEENYNAKDAGSFELYYKDYHEDYHYVNTFYFDKYIRTKSFKVKNKIYGIKIVKKSGYELNLDQVTLNNKTDLTYERKLSSTDNDVIEIENELSFDLKGKGELIITGRAPLTLHGPEYAFRFPDKNTFLDYTINSKFSSFSDTDLVIPNSDFSFHKIEKVGPGSGHPCAPVDYYVANDNNYLYILNEVFLDNTFDHGKDYSKVYIKTDGKIKEYQVNTVESNTYGNWWFEYTDSRENIKWQHMSYLIKVPLSDISNSNIGLSFEYYGTGSSSYIDCYASFSVKDDDGKPIEGAEFEITVNYNPSVDEEIFMFSPYYTNNTQTVYSDSNGIVQFLFDEYTFNDYYNSDSVEGQRLSSHFNRTVTVTQLSTSEGLILPEPKTTTLSFNNIYVEYYDEHYNSLDILEEYGFYYNFDVYFDLVFEDTLSSSIVNEQKKVEDTIHIFISENKGISDIFSEIASFDNINFEILDDEILELNDGTIIPIKVGTTDIRFKYNDTKYILHVFIESIDDEPREEPVPSKPIENIIDNNIIELDKITESSKDEVSNPLTGESIFINIIILVFSILGLLSSITISKNKNIIW